MNKQDFLNLDDDARLDYLNSELEAGKSVGDINTALGLGKAELGNMGFYVVKGKFIRRNMAGYRVTPSE